MSSSIFPDVNVWLALTHRRHVHHGAVAAWFAGLGAARLYFCRVTQVSFLRLLTTESVMREDVISQRQAWQTYLHWVRDEHVEFHPEPAGPELDIVFRKLSSRGTASPKAWADAYLAAFARTAGLTVATFDRAFAAMAGLEAILLPIDQPRGR